MPMPNPDLAELTEEENKDYEAIKSQEKTQLSYSYLQALKSLAASRATAARRLKLLEKHQYRNSSAEFDNDMYCVGCFASIHVPPGTSQSNIKSYTDKIVCKPGCALAAELRGGGETK